MLKWTPASAAATFAIGFSIHAVADPMTKDQYQAEKDRIAAEFKADKKNCASFAGNSNDICMAEAEGRKNIATSDLDAAFTPTDKARTAAQLARADAAYDIAKERCDELAGNAKAVCRTDAKSNYVKARVDAKAGREILEIRRTAAADKREADLSAALQRCAGLAGDARSQCESGARAQFGKL